MCRKKTKKMAKKNRKFSFKLSDYAIDIFIIGIGVAISLIELFWITDKHTGFIILVLTAIMEPILISIRIYIKKTFKEQKRIQEELLLNELKIFLDFKTSDDVPPHINEIWKPFALKTIKDFRACIEALCNGKMHLHSKGVTSFELEMLDRTQSEIIAIHMVENEDGLKYYWDPDEKTCQNSSMYLKMQELSSKNVVKKRLFVVENTNVSNELINRVIKNQQEKLGFEVKILYQNEMQTIATDEGFEVRDMLLRDSEELVYVTMQFNRCIGGEASIINDDIDTALRIFTSLWNHAKDCSDLAVQEGVANESK